MIKEYFKLLENLLANGYGSAWVSLMILLLVLPYNPITYFTLIVLIWIQILTKLTIDIVENLATYRYNKKKENEDLSKM